MNSKTGYLFSVVFIIGNLFQQISCAQSRDIDSLRQVSNKAKDDTTKIKILNELSKKYQQLGLYDSTINNADKTLRVVDKLKNSPSQVVLKESKRGAANAYNILGNTYDYQGNYPMALKNHLSALKIREEIGDKKGIANSLNNIGLVYQYQSNFKEAAKKHLEALKIRIEINDKKGIATSYNNIGGLYHREGKFAEAIRNYTSSLKIKENANDQNGIAFCYQNIGSVYDDTKDYKRALENYFVAIKIREEIGDRHGLCKSFASVGETYTGLKKYNEAELYCKKSLKLANELQEWESIRLVSQLLSSISERKSDYANSLLYYKQYIMYRDSLFNEENTKKTVRLEMNYEFDKKEAFGKLEQEKKEAVSMAESRKQKIIIWSVCGILILVFAFAVFAYRSYLQKQRANEAITKQKEIIEEKQKEILDSIYYARRIQRSLLTSEKYIDRNLNKLKTGNYTNSNY